MGGLTHLPARRIVDRYIYEKPQELWVDHNHLSYGVSQF